MCLNQQRFNAVLRSFTDRNYLLAKTAYEAAPTISGVKPSSLVTFCRHERNICNIWGKHKKEVGAVLGCPFWELKKTANHTLVLFYNRHLLTQTVAASDTQEFLQDLGYEPGITLEKILPALSVKLESGAFPHELGLLLGIPRDDVVAFITNRGAGCLFCGYWKVYQNPAWARSMFQEYDAAKLRVMNDICETEELLAAGSVV